MYRLELNVENNCWSAAHVWGPQLQQLQLVGHNSLALCPLPLLSPASYCPCDGLMTACDLGNRPMICDLCDLRYTTPPYLVVDIASRALWHKMPSLRVLCLALTAVAVAAMVTGDYAWLGCSYNRKWLCNHLLPRTTGTIGSTGKLKLLQCLPLWGVEMASLRYLLQRTALDHV